MQKNVEANRDDVRNSNWWNPIHFERNSLILGFFSLEYRIFIYNPRKMVGTRTLRRKWIGSMKPMLMAPLGKRRNNSYYRLLEFWAFLLLIWHYKKSKINKCCNQKSINVKSSVFSFIFIFQSRYSY